MQPTAENAPIAQRSRALVIDDDPGVQRLMSRLLPMHGVQIARASDGEEGLRRALITTYDVVLLDLNLPRLDGMTVLRRLLTTRPTQRVIVCSGQSDATTRVECMHAGARWFLPKPFTLAALGSCLRAALA